MKQRLYTIFLMVGIALLLASCSDDDHSFVDDGDGDGSGEPGGTGDNVSMSMRIPLPDSNLFTRSYGGTSRGSTYGEILINDVRMVLYGANNVVLHCFDLDVALDVDGSDNIEITGADVIDYNIGNESITIQTAAKTIGMGSYQLLVIINPSATIKAKTEPGQLIAELDAPFDTNSMYSYRTVNGVAEPAYFLMFNSQGIIEIKPENFYNTKTKAEENPVYVTLERVAAKVDCEYTGPASIRSTAVTPYGRFVMLLDYNNQTIEPWGTDYDIPEDCVDCPVHGCDGKFDLATKRCSAKPLIHTYDGLGLVADRVRYMVATDMTWQIDIVNKKSYWLRKLAYKANGDMEEQGDIDRENFYAEDPNFSGFSGGTGLGSEFSYITSTSALDPNASGSAAKRLFPTLPPASYKYIGYWSWTAADADTDPIYIPENTMAQSEQKYDVTTRALFKVILKREKFVADGTDLNPTTLERIGDFFVFKGVYKNIRDYKYNNYNKDSTTFFILRPEDVAVYASAPSANNIHVYLRDSILYAIEQFKNDNPSFNWNKLDENTEPAISEKLIFYKNGEMYYEAPIEHFSVSETGFGGYGRFGVVRNNWYKLNVENIISIGHPTIPAAASGLIEGANANRSIGGLKSTGGSVDYLIRNQSIIF